MCACAWTHNSSKTQTYANPGKILQQHVNTVLRFELGNSKMVRTIDAFDFQRRHIYFMCITSPACNLRKDRAVVIAIQRKPRTITTAKWLRRTMQWERARRPRTRKGVKYIAADTKTGQFWHLTLSIWATFSERGFNNGCPMIPVAPHNATSL